MYKPLFKKNFHIYHFEGEINILKKRRMDYLLPHYFYIKFKRQSMKNLLLYFLLLLSSSKLMAADITKYSSGSFDKPVILIEGYDPINDQNATTYYQMIPSSFRTWLTTTGRDLVIITFNDTHVDLRDLAEEFESALISINAQKTGTHPNAVIGYSNGGLIARWALKEMENQGTDHETSIYISYDSPHLGATIPQSIYNATKEVENEVPSIFRSAIQAVLKLAGEDDPFMNIDQAWDALSSTAARQVSLGEASSSSTSFLSEINDLGYPNNLARMAIANGSNSGQPISLPNGAYIYDYKIEFGQLFTEKHTIRQEELEPCRLYPCNPAYPIDYDRAPGSTLDSYEEFWSGVEMADSQTGVDADVYFIDEGLTSHSFISTFSAFDIEGFGINSAITSLMEDYGPFDDYGANSLNTPHDEIDSSFANGSTGIINNWLTEYHREEAVIPSRSHKKVGLPTVSSVDVERLTVVTNLYRVTWDQVPGAAYYKFMTTPLTGPEKLGVSSQHTGTSKIWTPSVHTQIAIVACNEDGYCSYPAFEILTVSTRPPGYVEP